MVIAINIHQQKMCNLQINCVLEKKHVKRNENDVKVETGYFFARRNVDTFFFLTLSASITFLHTIKRHYTSDKTIQQAVTLLHDAFFFFSSSCCSFSVLIFHNILWCFPPPQCSRMYYDTQTRYSWHSYK